MFGMELMYRVTVYGIVLIVRFPLAKWLILLL